MTPAKRKSPVYRGAVNSALKLFSEALQIREDMLARLETGLDAALSLPVASDVSSDVQLVAVRNLLSALQWDLQEDRARVNEAAEVVAIALTHTGACIH